MTAGNEAETLGPVTVDLDRARALFDGEGLGWLVDRLQNRLARGQALGGRIRLQDPTDRQREAFERLVGRRPGAARSISADLAELTAVVRRARIAPDLRTLVEALRGPVAERAAEAAAREALWDAVYQRIRTGAAEIDPALARWAEELEASGLLRRLGGGPEQAERLGDAALAVLARLPARGVPLPGLAAAALGNSHALDDGTPLSTLVLRAVEVMTGLPRRNRSAFERRSLWARVGVLLDELSAPALVLGLRPGGDGFLDRVLRAHADAGEPFRLTLRALVRHPPDWSPLRHAVIAVCENPTVVAAAADRLGASSPPLVCTEGQPSGAVQTLLRQLTEAGASLRFHTDFDRGGIRIGNLLVDRFGALPWRMGRADYLAAPDASVPLDGAGPVEASWDPDLATAMAARGRAVHEEQVLERLLADLAARPWPPGASRASGVLGPLAPSAGQPSTT